MMTEALIGAFVVILIAVLGFFIKRERELGVMQASLRAMHKRQDRFEGRLDSHINGKEKGEGK